MNYIEFKKTRQFGDKISATFEFIKLNFKPLFTVLLNIAGPAILLSSVVYVMFLNEISGLFSNIQSGVDFFTFDFGLKIFLYMLLVSISYLLLVVSVLEYINIYNEKKVSDISVAEVWDRVRKSFVHAFFGSFFILLLFIVLGVLSSMIFAVIVQVPVLSVFAVMGLIIFFIYLVVAVSLFNNILINERKGVSDFNEIIARCFYLVKGKWWSTFGILIISGIIVNILSTVLSIPLGASQLTEFFTAIRNGESSNSAMYDYSLWELVYTGIAFIGQQLFYVITIVALSFQYFNLVERREAKGLVEQIGGIESNSEDAPKNRTSKGDEEEHY
ncbi:MAG: hypothetical protein OEW75_03540 [Cyclobacteriaceae bacterium]|nr:hypothetical protein [Cyclobacteriaceae bacterium]